MITQDTIVLNDFGLARRDRTSSSGKVTSRYTVTIQAEPLVHTYNAKAMGEGPANAIADHLRERIQGIRAMASPSTQKKRLEAARAFDAGKPWAMRRYSGGRLGPMKPDEGEGRAGALFNDSGRFVKSIVANPTREQEWVVNIAANRLDPSTFRDGEAGVVAMVERLRQYVPEFGDSAKLMQVPAVREAIALAADMILVDKLGAAFTKNKRLRADLRRGALDALLKGAQLITGV